MNDLDYSFKFVYFAIYKSDYKQPNEVENYYKDKKCIHIELIKINDNKRKIIVEGIK